MKLPVLSVLLLIILVAGCTPFDEDAGVTTDLSGGLNNTEESTDTGIIDDGLVGELGDVGSRTFRVVDKAFTYYNGYLTISWDFEDENGYPPSTDWTACFELIEYPEDYELMSNIEFPLGEKHVSIGAEGDLIYSIEAPDPGTYKFRICGVYGYEQEEAYSGDGDELVAEVPERTRFYVREKYCNVTGSEPTYGYECRWYLEFMDGSTGICQEIPFYDWEICKGTESDYRCTTPLNCRNPVMGDPDTYDYIIIRGSISSGHSMIAWINGVDSDEIEYIGDGDRQEFSAP